MNGRHGIRVWHKRKDDYYKYINVQLDKETYKKFKDCVEQSSELQRDIVKRIVLRYVNECNQESEKAA